MKRTLFGEEHEIFRKAFRQFLQKEVVPNQEAWREEGSVSREVWRAAGMRMDRVEFRWASDEICRRGDEYWP